MLQMKIYTTKERLKSLTTQLYLRFKEFSMPRIGASNLGQIPRALSIYVPNRIPILTFNLVCSNDQDDFAIRNSKCISHDLVDVTLLNNVFYY